MKTALEYLKEKYSKEIEEYYSDIKELSLKGLILGLELYESAKDTGVRHPHRWWDEVEMVIPIKENLGIRFLWAEANRDESVKELGWEFDESSVYLVKPVEVKTIKWEKL